MIHFISRLHLKLWTFVGNMQVNAQAFNDIRQRLEASEKENRTLKLNLEAQTVEANQLNKLYFKLKDDYQLLKRENNRLEGEVREAVARNLNAGNLQPIVFNKLWKDVINWGTKRKRKVLYRQQLDNSIKNITECVKAWVVLTLGLEDVVFQWSEQELEFNRDQLYWRGFIPPPNIIPRQPIYHNAVQGPLYHERSDDAFQITHTKQEIRRVFFIMDNYCVSHHAYHELHLLSKGFLPPLNQIEEKKELMDALEYYVFERVIILCFVSK